MRLTMVYLTSFYKIRYLNVKRLLRNWHKCDVITNIEENFDLFITPCYVIIVKKKIRKQNRIAETAFYLEDQ